MDPPTVKHESWSLHCQFGIQFDKDKARDRVKASFTNGGDAYDFTGFLFSFFGGLIHLFSAVHIVVRTE